jgi:hypothetical protein
MDFMEILSVESIEVISILQNAVERSTRTFELPGPAYTVHLLHHMWIQSIPS